MIRPIVQYDDAVLREKGAPVAAFDAALGSLIRDLNDTLAATETGIGLAAPQIGRALPVCVVDLRGTEPDFGWNLDGRQPPLDLWMPLALVNPVVVEQRGPSLTVEEGCLSFPDIRGPVSRQEAVVVRYQDPQGNPHTLEADGLLGRCLLHEIDHLNGILFIDRMDPSGRRKVDTAVRALARRQNRAPLPPP